LIICGVVLWAAAAGAAEVGAGAWEAKAIEGEVAFWRGDYVSAELAFFEVLMARPEDTRAHYYLGRIYNTRGSAARAAEHLEEAAGPAYPEAFFFLGAAYHDLGRAEEAAARYLKYLEFYPDDAAAWFNLAVAYDASGRPEEAENAYHRVLTEDPRNVAALHNLAVLYHRRGDYNRAIFFWRHAVEMAPAEAEAYYGLGLSYYHAGDYVEAALAFNEGALRAPLASKYFYQLGRTYLVLGLYDLAVQFYQRAFELGYDEGAAAEGMGLAYEGWRRYNEATALLKKAAVLRGEEAGEAYAALGRIGRAQGRAGEALAHFYEAAARLDDDAEVHNQIGELYLEADLPSWAAEAFGKAVAAEPKNLDYNYNLAVARELSEPAEAVEPWRRFVELAENVPGEKKRLAEARRRLARLARDHNEEVTP
jgi:tetratricopeptide (TPR) repeat protein